MKKLRRTTCGSGYAIVVVVMFLSVFSGAYAFSDLSGNRCRPFSLADGAWDYWDQPQFLPQGSLTRGDSQRQAELAHRAWAIKDNRANHLVPAIKAMYTESGVGVGGSVADNLEFTLLRIPNHAEALKVLVEYAAVIKRKPLHRPLLRAPECYFHAAMQFASKDAHTRLLYGVYLFRSGRFELALKAFDDALTVNPNSVDALYNKGLTLVKLERLDEALSAAREAYRRGYPLPGLRRMLERKGYDVSLKVEERQNP